MVLIPTLFSDINISGILYIEVVINEGDLVDRGAKPSNTTRRTKRGDPVKRLVVVLSKDATTITVTHVATFDQSSFLPEGLDRALWYPIEPAQREGLYVPLPAINTKAGWVSLRRKQILTAEETDRFPKVQDMAMDATSVAAVLQAMRS